MKAVTHFKTKIMHNFYKLFGKWAQATRLIVYNNIKAVRMMRLRIVMRKWRKYLKRT
jgi:hypothetical protein